MHLEVCDKFYECHHSTNEHKVVVVNFILCRFNFSHDFERNYYASTNCCCKSKFRTDDCVFCRRLECGLNLKVLKICMEEKIFPSYDFNYIDINEYLKDLPGDAFFNFFEKDNMTSYLTDNPESGDCFENKEGM